MNKRIFGFSILGLVLGACSTTSHISNESATIVPSFYPSRSPSGEETSVDLNEMGLRDQLDAIKSEAAQDSSAARFTEITNDLISLGEIKSHSGSLIEAALHEELQTTHDGSFKVSEIAEILIKSHKLLLQYRPGSAADLTPDAFKLRKSIVTFNKTVARELGFIVSKIANKSSEEAKDVGNLLSVVRQCSLGKVGSQKIDQYTNLIREMVGQLLGGSASSEDALYIAMDNLGIDAPKATIVIDALPPIPRDAMVKDFEMTVKIDDGYPKDVQQKLKLVVEKNEKQVWLQAASLSKENIPDWTLILRNNGKVIFFNHQEGYVNSDIFDSSTVVEWMLKLTNSPKNSNSLTREYGIVTRAIMSSSPDFFKKIRESEAIGKPLPVFEFKDITRPISRRFSDGIPGTFRSVTVGKWAQKVVIEYGRESLTLDLQGNVQNGEQSGKISPQLAHLLIKDVVRGTFLDNASFRYSLTDCLNAIEEHIKPEVQP